MRNMRQHLLIGAHRVFFALVGELDLPPVPKQLRLSALMLSGLMPMGSGPDPEPLLDHGRRSRPISPPYSPPKREPTPLTPEQIKATEKRARKAAKMKGTP